MRQNTRPQPHLRHMHIYQRFDGGLNTVDANEKIADHELQDLVNVDLGERGTLKRRHGMELHITGHGGYGQGYFRYFKEGIGYEEIVAENGQFYIGGILQEIQGLSQFQTTRPIEAVQFRDKLYIATGTKLVEYDGTTFKVVNPYKPEPLEALYIGTNALAENPSDFMQHGVGTHLRVDGVTFNRRYGLVNEPIVLRAFITKPQEMNIEYKFEMRTPGMREGFWEQLTEGKYQLSNTFSFTPQTEGDLSFRVWAKEIGKTEFEAKQYLIPKYKVKPVADPSDKVVPDDTIHSCNRIILHWNRLIMYGDVNQPDAIFISHLNKPDYFPVPNSLIFESERRERITSIVRYRDMLVVFTPSTIQALFGKSPMDYQRFMMNSSIGCIAPYSTTIIGNYIAFLSNEGVQMLLSVGDSDTKINVQKIDIKIENIMERDTNACAITIDNQYMILFPNSQRRYRYYYEKGAWTKDQSIKLDFTRMYEWDGELYGLSSTSGNVYKFNKNVYMDDDYLYEDRIETKNFDFDEPYHDKKLKEMQLIMASQNQRTEISTYVYADASLILDTNTSHATVDEDGNVDWVYQNEPNFKLVGGSSLGSWRLGESPFGEVSSERYKVRLSGRCRSTRLILIHNDAAPIQLLGIGYIFKTKKP